MGVGRAPIPPSGGIVVVNPNEVVLPDTQLVTVINPETGEPELVEAPVTFGPGRAVGIIEEDGVETYRLVGAFQDTGFPSSFLGFQTNVLQNDETFPIVMTSRGSRIEAPIVTDGAALVAGKDVFLSIVPGEITQDPKHFDLKGSVLLRVGYAISATKIALVPDFRVRL